MNEYTVLLIWDDEASKWAALNDDIPIILEDASLDTLIDRVKTAAPELLMLNGQPHTDIHLFFQRINSQMKFPARKSIIADKKLFTLVQLSEDVFLDSLSCPIDEYNEYLLYEAVRSRRDQMALTWLFQVITVDADIEHNESVIEFYRKNGFILMRFFVFKPPQPPQKHPSTSDRTASPCRLE
jgi:hypothetical protein